MVFLLDTNVLFKLSFLRELSGVCRAGRHRLLVSALSHTERVFQLRRQHGSNFDPAIIQRFLDSHGIEILSFDRGEAEQVAAALGDSFDTHEAWSQAKWRRCARCTRCDAEPPTQPRCPATIDWFIARHRTGEAVFLITDDKGEEFRGVQVLRPDAALAQARGGSPA
jgi:hypothetical protein